MKFLNSLVFFFILTATTVHAEGQDVPIGQWKDYLSYQSNLKVCQGLNIIYCTSQSGIFTYNLNDNSIERYNRVTGLSDVSPSVARYNPYNHSLLIGYSDGNIDILQNNQVVNIPDLATAIRQGSKVINDIYFSGDTAYLSCGQGILQIEMSQDVILNTFNLSSTGNPINVYSMTICNDSIFAVTIKGVYKAFVRDSNLNNYNDWHKINNPVLAKGIYNAVATLGNKVYVNFSNYLTSNAVVSNKDTIYVDSAGIWKHYIYVQGNAQVNSLESTNGYLLISALNEVKMIDKNSVLVNDVSNYGNSIPALPSDAIADANGNIWIADTKDGLVESTGNGNGLSICPPGPFSNYVTSIAVEDNNIWITPGGYNQSGHGDLLSDIGVSAYLNNTWYRILDPYVTIFDINYVVIDPHNPVHAFAGSWFNGVIEYTNNSVTKVYDTTNSSLHYVDGFKSVEVGGLGFDTLGNLWVTNSYVKSDYLSVMKTDGSWRSFNFNTFLNPFTSVIQLVVTKSGAKWMAAGKVGILVYQDNGTFVQPNSSNTILINTQTGNGALPSLNISAMAEDLNGTIWVGTDQSVVAFYSPDNVLDGNHDWDAQPIYVNQNGYTQYLMQNQVTTAIAVDGANRKWIGTQGGGVFLMSADGTQQIYNFTTANSPLLSNNINCIAINSANGEVFFGTDKGIVSFRGTATEGGDAFGNVYAFPNPVPHGYNGVVAIKGLISNSDVKITTVSGELVYHTVALGGQAIWAGTNFNGERVKTGVYLVFCASPDGTQSTVTKLLFIN